MNQASNINSVLSNRTEGEIPGNFAKHFGSGEYAYMKEYKVGNRHDRELIHNYKQFCGYCQYRIKQGDATLGHDFKFARFDWQQSKRTLGSKVEADEDLNEITKKYN